MDGIVTIDEWRVAGLDEAQIASDVAMLAEVLWAAVEAGASVSFVAPFGVEDARAYWERTVVPDLGATGRRVLVARVGGEIVGTVQLGLTVPANQRHRAEVMKLLVHPKARRLGIGRKLMAAVEGVAREEGRTLLTLDTRLGDIGERLYASMGYVLTGVIPRYARGPHSAELEGTSIFYKEIG